MSLLLDVVEVIRSEWGWLLVFALLVWELFWPLWDTRLQKLVHSISDDVENQVERVEGKVESIDDKQTAHIQVTRAMARDSNVSNERVDEYLVENGVSIDYFFENEPQSADD